MLNQQVNLFHVPFDELFDIIRQEYSESSYDFTKHLINVLSDSGDQLGFIRLPLHIAIGDKFQILNTEVKTLYLSIESGNATLAMNQGKRTIQHSSISSYMSRKKQGFSQIKYLNKKGKSKAGSRVRLARTIEFFEKINQKSTAYMDVCEPDRIAISCTASLIPYLYQSKVRCPFQKNDQRLYKIPLHIPQSNYTNLQSTIKKLMAPILFYDQVHESQLNNLINISN